MWSYFKLILWGCIWFWFWLFSLPFRKGRDNCLTWAQRQHDTRGGYLTIRWSRNTKGPLSWPHFGWISDEHHDKIVHYVPKVDRLKYIPDMWFEGHVKEGDEDEGN